MVNGVGLQAELTCLSRDCVDPRSAPCGLPNQQCHPRETLTWRHRASRIGLLRKQLVIENLRLPETEVDGELNATRDAPGTARSTLSELQVELTVPVRTLWFAYSKMPSKGNPDVESSRKPYRLASKVTGYREPQASQNGSYW